MKKLLALFALGFLLVLALPTPALAHNPGVAVGGAILVGMYTIAIIISTVMSIIIALKTSSFDATFIMAIINGILFLYFSSLYFEYPTKSDPIISTFIIICLINIMLVVSKSQDLCQYRDIIIGILGLYIFILIGYRLNIHYQDKCYDAIIEGNKKYCSFCVKVLGVNKKISNHYSSPKPLIKWATREGQPEIVKLLISKGAKDIDADVISVLAATGDIEMVKQLLDKSCERTKNNKHNDSKCYAIDISGIGIAPAVLAKKYEMIDFLISQGANTEIHFDNIQDKEMIQFLVDKNIISKDLELKYAAQNGDIDRVKEIIKNVSTTNTKINYGISIPWAVRNGHVEIVKLLINAGADVNYYSEIIKLAIQNCPDVVRLLIDKGANVNAKDDDGNTALSMAAEYGHTESLSLLLKAGANVNAKDRYGNTALMEAARNGHIEIIKLLIDSGADVNVVDDIGRTALMNAIYDENTQSISILIAAGADVNAKNKYGITALFEAIKEGNTRNIELLLDAGADPNNINWYRLLTENVRDEEVKTETMFMFLKAGADVNAKDKNSRTPLIEASYQGKVNIIRKLIKFGADVNAKDKDSNTALNYACKEGHLNAAKILIQAGADVNANVYEGFHSVETSLIRASRRNEKDFVQILIESGANVNAVDNYGRTALMKTHNAEITKLLIAAGADINIKDNQGHTALFHTAKDAQFDRVKILLDAGANIDIKDNEGKTVLDEVRRRGYENIKNLLESYENKTPEELKQMHERKVSEYKQMAEKKKVPSVKDEPSSLTENEQTKNTQPTPQRTRKETTKQQDTVSPSKEEINTPDQFGETPLLKAVKKGQTEEVKNLIAQGADVNFVNHFKESVLMVAVKKNKPEIVKLLINAGADINYKDNFGKSILQVAEQKGFTEIIDILKSN